MKGLIPHDRSLVFRLLQRYLSPCARLLEIWLKDVTSCVYFARFAQCDVAATARP